MGVGVGKERVRRSENGGRESGRGVKTSGSGERVGGR